MPGQHVFRRHVGELARGHRQERRPKVKRLRNLEVREGSLVDRPANPGASIALFKAHSGGKAMEAETILKAAGDVAMTGAYDRGDIDAAIRDYLGDVEPELAPGAALLKRWGADPVLSRLYEAHQEAPEPEPEEPVEKAGEPGARAWAEIEKRALALCMTEDVTKAAATSIVLERDPDLYKRYVDEQRGAADEDE